jgi:hypothetical protein
MLHIYCYWEAPMVRQPHKCNCCHRVGHSANYSSVQPPCIRCTWLHLCRASGLTQEEEIFIGSLLAETAGLWDVQQVSSTQSLETAKSVLQLKQAGSSCVYMFLLITANSEQQHLTPKNTSWIVVPPVSRRAVSYLNVEHMGRSENYRQI